MEDNFENNGNASLAPGYKSVCTRLWLVMLVAFGLRIAGGAVFGKTLNSLGGDKRAIAELIYAVVVLNVLPIAASIFIMRFRVGNEARKMYVKPKYFGRALSIFPAGYGLAMMVLVITAVVGALTGTGIGLRDLFRETNAPASGTTALSAWINFVHAVIFAPLFEEFWFRGVIMQSLRPYGNGVAIFVSAVMFGLAHGNFAQLFFTSVVGVIFGYAAVQTGSLYTSMALHALFNTPSALLNLFMADEDVSELLLKMLTQESIEYTPIMTFFLVFMVILIGVVVVGVIMAFVKLSHISRYRVPKVQDEMTARRRWGILLTRLTMIPALLAIAYVFLKLTPEKLVKLFTGGQ